MFPFLNAGIVEFVYTILEFLYTIISFLNASPTELLSLLFQYVNSHQEQINRLSESMEELKNKRAILRKEIDADGGDYDLKKTGEVELWLEKIGTLEQEADAIDVQFQGLSGYHPLNVWARYKLSKKAAEKLKEAEDLKRMGALDAVADNDDLQHLIQTMPSFSTVGTDEILRELSSVIGGTEVGIVGIYGMGGVGKTALLNRLNNELRLQRREHGFDIVMLIDVSDYFVPRETIVEKIQRAITRRLKLDWQEGKEQKERALHILHVLSRKRFVIMLDDIWEPLDLSSVGIPIPESQSGCKVILATRIEDVCARMDAQKVIKLECLPGTKAWNLFVEKAGKNFISSQPEIKRHAKVIAEKCGGLPLAVTEIGRAMATRKSPEEWKHAIRALDNATPGEIQGMKESVFHTLKRSYDNLPNNQLKSCFLYISLYPKGFSIHKTWLIDYWVCEGIIDRFESMDEAYDKGFDIIGQLQRASLLEKGDDDDQVKMHSIIRYVALWIASKCGTKWVVQAGVGLNQAPDIEKWRGAERISLMHSNISDLEFEEAPYCPNLLSLMLNGNREVEKISNKFFLSMTSLKVLDLSETSIQELPPEIKKLSQLQYLDLSQTKLKSLPIELGDLAKLTFLNLGYTLDLETIPKGVIAGLSKSLQVLSTHFSYHLWNGQVPLKELEGLRQLKRLDITISNAEALHRLAKSSQLSSSIRILHISVCEGMPTIRLPSAFIGMKNIRKLAITNSFDLEEILIGEGGGKKWQLPNLEFLLLVNLGRAKIIWRGVLPREFPPNLVNLVIHSCPRIEQLVEEVTEEQEEEEEIREEGEVGIVFPVLRLIQLVDLPELKSLCRRTLILPSLQTLMIRRCPKLKRLPFRSGSAKNLKEIRGEKKWWEGLEWKDDTTKPTFQRFFTGVY